MSKQEKKPENRTKQRTYIVDISSVGDELSDEHLLLIAGGSKSAGGTTNTGATDDYSF